ncbi:hypothetical protein [Flavihumibacter fluvii]|uniref:hypothetical protein n=1 Tax=Flavihumibacter fluvii TaxID=2838157 RepID=UPI001BDDE222|nr:hypothetical protein [Flavihumibacter fluvii]ULQ51436.1 hypothetical protein KJS93_15215 [Flavihumibacter fluvii]
MIKISRKFLFFPIKEYWFTYPDEIWGLFDIRAYNQIRTEVKVPLMVKAPNYTVAVDLRKSKEQILDGFSRTLKRLVRNAEKENIVCYTDGNISKFLAFYNEFALLKGIPPESYGTLEGYGPSLKICYAELNGQILAAHSFIMDKEEKIVRLMHSSSKRFDSHLDSNHIGRVNKYLYYWEMLAFKEQGIDSFDFGGYQEINSDKVIENLLRFKLDFGADKITTTNYFTIPYYFMKKAYLLMGIASKN